MAKIRKGIDVLDQIKSSKNIQATCKELGISRSQYYKLLHNPEPTKPKGYQPKKMGVDTMNRILELALEYPFGCHNIAYKLIEEGIRISPVSVQKILNVNNLGSGLARYQALREKMEKMPAYPLNLEQKEFLGKYNPALLEIHRMPTIGGDLITVFSYFLGLMPWLGKVHAYFGLDAYSGYVQAMVAFNPDKYLCAEFLKETIFPFYQKIGVGVTRIETSDDPEFFSYGFHPFSSFLRNKSNVKYQRTTVGGTKTNGFSQNWKLYLQKFIVPEIKKRKVNYMDLEALNEDLQKMVEVYNHGSDPKAQQYFQGYPFRNRSPLQILGQ